MNILTILYFILIYFLIKRKSIHRKFMDPDIIDKIIVLLFE